MIKYTDSTIFNAGAQTLVNTVNCVGVWGAGIALECKLRFPDMYGDYLSRCAAKNVEIGKPYLYRGEKPPWVLNFPTKLHWRNPSKIHWVRQGLEEFAASYEREGIASIAFPKLGCDRGGLNWDEVRAVMEEALQEVKINVCICLDREPEAAGTEGRMVEALNNKPDTFWTDQLGIRKNIAGKILASLPIKRFRELREIRGVGEETYEKIFKSLYSLAGAEAEIAGEI